MPDWFQALWMYPFFPPPSPIGKRKKKLRSPKQKAARKAAKKARAITRGH